MSTLRRDHFRRVRTVFEAAVEEPEDRQKAFVADTCGEDLAVRDDVLALLAAHGQAAEFLETPAASLTDGEPRPDLAGQQLGPYRIESLVGGGGMGDVYRARDTRLGRTVAIKVLSSTAGVDQPVRDRFEREARAVAALSHPHVCALYDIGQHEDVDFLVMEFLDGETLATRLARGPLSVALALEIAIQIASALDRAHRSGIVHRDLTPRNVMLTRSGAKLLDFGLAKPIASAITSQAGTNVAPTITTPGTILGTLHYMAPEQLEGTNADARADLFAFGCVLYEMLTAKKAFDARSSAGLLTAIMAHEPTPICELLPDVSPAVEYIIARCLAKDPDDRWQSARDLLADLQRTATDAGAVVERPTASRRSRLPVWAVSAVAVAAAAAVAAVAWSRSAPVRQATWLSILPPVSRFDDSPDPTVSPNGRYVAFKAPDAGGTTCLWLRDLTGPTSRALPGTDGVEQSPPPFWSPDSRSIGYFAFGRLKRIDIDGAAPQVLATAAEPHGGTWSPRGVIIFDNGDRRLYAVAASGGVSMPVPGTGPGQVRLFPYALPDGRHYLFTSRNINGLGEGVYVASLDTAEVRRISGAWSRAAYASGQLLFARQRVLFAQPFDLSRQATTGEPRPVADGIGVGCCTPLSFAFSTAGGLLAFWTGTNLPKTQLQWVRRDGTTLATVGESGIHVGFALSPDERNIALERQDPVASNYDIWSLDLARGGQAARFTIDGNAIAPVWSPDGGRVLVMDRVRGLVAMPWHGGAATTTVIADTASKWPSDWSPDGRHIAYLNANAGWRLWTAPAEGTGEPTLYRQAPFALGMMKFSPSGDRVAYVAEESGQREVYVDSFPMAGQKVRVSTAGGSWPAWRRDGRELYYLAPDRGLMAVAIRNEIVTGALSAPTRLFEAPRVGPDWLRMQYAPARDGSRFLFNALVEDRTPVGLTVVANWPALLANR